MPLLQITKVSGKAVPVSGADMDTDRIIPARFLKAITFDELADKMFYDERFNDDGSSKNHSIDAPQHANARIIFGGENFGCGSSREHAPQAINRSGIRAVVAESLAEIFFGNSTGIGLPCACASHEDISCAMKLTEQNPELIWTLDLASMTLSSDSFSCAVTMPSEPRKALMEGRWDAVIELMQAPEALERLAASLPNPSAR